jgi:hypothetical protein
MLVSWSLPSGQITILHRFIVILSIGPDIQAVNCSCHSLLACAQCLAGRSVLSDINTVLILVTCCAGWCHNCVAHKGACTADPHSAAALCCQRTWHHHHAAHRRIVSLAEPPAGATHAPFTWVPPRLPCPD